jgi:hypothetical protein
MMEIHAIQGDKITHVLTTHRTEKDDGPVHLVSAAKVAYWQTLEVDYEALLEKLEGAEK